MCYTDEKLENTNAANSMLGAQLQRMEPMLGELEKSLEASKALLKEESRLRHQAEKTIVEMESRCEVAEANEASLREKNEALREECEALQEDLEYRSREIEKMKKGDNHREINHFEAQRRSSTENSYAEILDELEGVTEQLMETQQKLWKAEDKLREFESRVQMIENSSKHAEKEVSRSKAGNSLLDLADDETIDAADNVVEQNLSEELEDVKRRLADAQNELKAFEEQAKHDQEKARVADENNSEIMELHRKISAKEQELNDSKEENILLGQEIACLRDVLQEQADKELRDAQSNAEIRSKEINALREKLKVIVKENAVLNEQVKRLENGLPASRTDEVARLKRDISQLRASLEKVEDDKSRFMQESDIEWHLKFEKLREELEDKKDDDIAQLRGQLIEEKTVALKSMEERLEKLADENYKLKEMVERLEGEVRRSKKDNVKWTSQSMNDAENLKLARDEIVVLKKKAGVLSFDLGHAKRKLTKFESEAKEARDQYADVCAELEVARQILDEAGLNRETIAREDERELKRQIHVLSKALEQMRQDYAELENDFLDNQHRFCDSQEEASRKTSDEIDYLTGKVAEMEAALEAARTDYSEMSVKLEHARKESHESAKKGEKQGRESTMRALKSEKIHEIRASNSEDLVELDYLRLQLGDSMAALDKAHEELYKCKGQLESSKKENSKLKEEITELEQSKKQGFHVLDEFLHANVDTKLRDVLDSEHAADDEGIEIVRASSKEFSFPFSWFTRDVTKENVEFLGTETLGEVHTKQSSSKEMYAQILQITRENEILKEKIRTIGSSREDELSFKPSSVVNTAEVKKVFVELEEALKTNKKTSYELERVSQKLATMERHLASTRKALEEASVENQDLRSEGRNLKEALTDTRRELENYTLAAKKVDEEMLAATERSNSFQALRDQLKTLINEKSALQHQLDDSKIALSVSQYAQERSKEELRASESKLASTSDEIFRLQRELNSMNRSFSDVKQAYDDVCDTLGKTKSENEGDGKKSVANLSKQIKQLTEENNGLQQMVTELEEALDLSQQEIDKKTKQVNSLHDSLISTQKETRLLTDEITNLTTAFEESKDEYNSVVGELEAVCELFKEAREEAEINGKEATIHKIRNEREGNQETERQDILEQAKKIFEENGALRRKLGKLEHAFAEAGTANTGGREIMTAKQEIHILKEALRVSEEEVHFLKEKELKLIIALKEAKHELRNVRDELEMASQSFDDSRRAAERTARASAVEEFRSLDSNEDLKVVREKLKKMLEDSELDIRNTVSTESEGGRRTEALRLKMELLDMSMSLEKIIKENAVIEEELEYVKRAAEDARKEGEKDGKLKAMRDLRKEMEEQRVQEIKELKDIFDGVVEQNTSLSQKLRETEIKLSVAIRAREESADEVDRLQNDLNDAKIEILRFQQHVSGLVPELQPTHESTATTQSDKSETKEKALMARLSALAVDNTRLRTKLKNAESMLDSARSSEERRLDEIESLLSSLEESQVLIDDLEDQVADLTKELYDIRTSNGFSSHEAELLQKFDSSLAQSRTAKDVDDVKKAFHTTMEDNTSLKLQVSQLKQMLKESSMELDQLRAQLDRVSTDIAPKDNNESYVPRTQIKRLAEEKGTLQWQLDESRSKTLLQTHPQPQSIEGNINQDSIQSSNNSSSTEQFDLSQVQDELTKAQGDVKDAMKVMGQINQILDSVEGIRISDTASVDRLSHRAEHIKAKVTEIILLLQKTRNEQSCTEDAMIRISAENDVAVNKIIATEAALQQLRQAQLNARMDLELKYAEAKREASGYKNEVSRLKLALDSAQRDQSSLRGQLEHMNLRVGQLCMEAEARGKRSNAEALPSGVNNVDESDRKELNSQFQRFYTENISLQSKLVKMEADLEAAKEAEDKQKTMAEQLERDAKQTAEKAEVLEAANKRLTQEMNALREDLEGAKKNRSDVVNELCQVKERLTEIRAAKAVESGERGAESITSAISDRDAEIRFLQDQLKKLSKKSISLGKKVEEAEAAVCDMRTRQEKTRSEGESRQKQARDLQGQVKKAIELSLRRDHKIEDLTTTMGSRVSKVEDNVSLIEKTISTVTGKRRVTEPGFLVTRKHTGETKASFEFENVVVEHGQKDLGATDEDSSIHSADYHITSESRQDYHVDGAAMSREAPPPHQQISVEETNLTSRALEAIALSKKKSTLRKIDVQATQSKIFGARTSEKIKSEEVPVSDSLGRD